MQVEQNGRHDGMTENKMNKDYKPWKDYKKTAHKESPYKDFKPDTYHSSMPKESEIRTINNEIQRIERDSRKNYENTVKSIEFVTHDIQDLHKEMRKSRQ